MLVDKDPFTSALAFRQNGSGFLEIRVIRMASNETPYKGETMQEDLESSLREILRGHPDEMYVTDNLIAVMDENEHLFVIESENLRGKTAEELNLIFQQGLALIVQDL